MQQASRSPQWAADFLSQCNLEDGPGMTLADAISGPTSASADLRKGAGVLKPRGQLGQLQRLRMPLPSLQEFVVLLKHLFDRFRMKQIQSYRNPNSGARILKASTQKEAPGIRKRH